MSAGEHGLEGVAAGASARVGEILAEAEGHARGANEEAERAAEAIRADALKEVERIAAEAREAAREAARERSERLAELQSALNARGPAVVDGLEGAGLTRARLESLIEALAATAERVAREAEEGAPAPAPAAPDEPASAPAEEESSAGAAHDPVAAAEEFAQPVIDEAADDESASNGNGDAPARYDGPLPHGAPLARRPGRSRERDARFAALLLAVQGRERGDVEAHLRHEYGFADCEPILDEVFGPTHA
jgi:hypothetical protein